MNHGGGTYTFNDAEQLVFALEQALESVGIAIAKGSAFEDLCLNIIRIAARHRGEIAPVSATEDIRIAFRDFLGMADFAAKLWVASTHGTFAALKPHLELLNQADVAMNRRTLATDGKNNKLLELYVACLCINSGATSVDLDHPDNSKGTNPDVIATFDGVVWGFACKSLHTTQEMTMLDNVKKAISQIHRSPATVGMPVLGLKNILPHEQIWPALRDPSKPDEYIFTAELSSAPAVQVMSDFVESLQAALIRAAGVENYFGLFAGRAKVPGFITLSPSVTAVYLNGDPVPTRLNLAMVHPAPVLTREEESVLIRIHAEYQRVPDAQSLPVPL